MNLKKTIFSILFVLALFAASPAIAEARVRVSGYYRSNGTYVQSYYRSSPNVYKWDNYNYKNTQPRYNNSYYSRSYNSNSPLYTPDYSYSWNR